MGTNQGSRESPGDGIDDEVRHRLDPVRFAEWLVRVREHQREVIESRGGDLFDVDEIDDLLASVRGG